MSGAGKRTVLARWRRIATRLVRHASWVLPGAESDWAEAMRREIDYIEDDTAALRWAVGCVTASYATRLTAIARWRWRVAPGPVFAGSALLLMAMALQGHASDEAPVINDTKCELPVVASEIHPQGRDRDGLHRKSESDTCSDQGRETMRNGRRNITP